MSLRDVGFSVVFCAVSLALAPLASGASLLTPYNVIVSGNFADVNSDVGGGLAVGGIATLNSFSVADGLNGEPVSAFTANTTFVAAGGVSGEASLYNGNWYSSGTDSTFYTTGDHTGSKDATDPVSTSMTPFSTMSNAWHADAATAGDGCTVSGSVTTCTVTKAGMNVIDVAASQVAAGQTLNINGVSSADWLILNVAGTADTLSGNMRINGSPNNGDSSPISAEDVLFNFYQANSLTLGGSSMGSVLAAGANVTGGGGQFVGSLVAASFTDNPSCGGTEFHNFTFQGGATPEPAPVAFVGAGLIALALGLKRRRRIVSETGDGVVG
jgi:choice-of-anchor A domain-containing protein